MADFFRKAFVEVKRLEEEHPRGFEEFRKKHFNIEYYTDLVKNPPIADLYVAGSDQIWGWFGDGNYLNFGSQDSVKRISIASSFGGEQPKSPEEWSKLSNYLQAFDLVTVREPDGVETCCEAGCHNVHLIPDPTLLFKQSYYEKYIDDTLTPKKQFILLYLLGNTTKIIIDDIYNYALQNDLDVVYVVSQGRIDSYDKVYPTVSQWLSLIKNARYVITNSFHGMAFSIIFHKQFLIYPLAYPFERMNGRVFNLTEKYGLNSRLFNGDLTKIEEEISYVEIEEIRNTELQNVICMFKKVLIAI